jgi:hypothetical protein
MKLRARLVTLSACETALGKGYFTETPAGDEFVGMTRLSQCGRSQCPASLWTVNDESTRALMTRFYRHLHENGGAAALARAQREVRESDVRYQRSLLLGRVCDGRAKRIKFEKQIAVRVLYAKKKFVWGVGPNRKPTLPGVYKWTQALLVSILRCPGVVLPE